ncbi:MAG: membrane protein insertion efficiency factor YidD [Deltaproteobacteria bacterium]|nr:membrane protein insertion efficiency factor YidD [Deltaproteobacteria bacterium]
MLYRKVVKAFFDFYRYFLSPVLHSAFPGSGCRFRPTCSEYAKEAMLTHGFFKGLVLSFRRLVKCRPSGGLI